MPSKFDEKSVRKELFGILVDSVVEVTSDTLEELMDELMQVVEDVYYKGYERGKVVNETTLREIEIDIEELDDIALETDWDLFPSEPE